MNLKKFTQNDIENIYDYLTIHSIEKYKTTSNAIQEFYETKINNTKQTLFERNLTNTSIPLTELTKYLDNYQTIYNKTLKENNTIISNNSPKIINLITNTISQLPDDLDKISLLFDFITNYLTYSENYSKYCLDQPFNTFYTFDFKNNIPVDHSIEGTLITKQGLCSEITNLITYLGKKINLKIETLLVSYNDKPHNINLITINNKNYLIDATRKIRQDKSKEECFLVSASLLNKDNNYILDQNLKTSTYQNKIPNYHSLSQQLINDINNHLSEIKNLSSHLTK